MRLNKSWKVSLIGLIILSLMVILIETPQIVAEAFPVYSANIFESDAELITLDEVVNQVKAFDKDADTKLVNEPEGTFLNVYWSDNQENPIVIDVISVGDGDFLCRGEDVRSMMTDALKKH